jgi:hypothetical protein
MLSLDLMAEIASDEVLEQAYVWLCDRRKEVRTQSASGITFVAGGGGCGADWTAVSSTSSSFRRPTPSQINHTKSQQC